ncbi:MAG: septal ring lytic transglycosylase RlpA family protein [Candidatus Omnitrophota bacterium]|jgi:rare lipoprotein A (peptidoglycan hydrolase)
MKNLIIIVEALIIAVLVIALGVIIESDTVKGCELRDLRIESDARNTELAVLGEKVINLEAALTIRTGASHYGGWHNGRLTASGAVFNDQELTAASPWLPFGRRIRVTNIRNGKSVVCTVTDRGPHPRLGRGLDLSTAAARALGMLREGVIDVDIYLGE